MKNIRRVLAVTAGVVWVLCIVGSAAWGQAQMRRSLMELAEAGAAASFNKDVVCRRWVAMHGGLYVSPTEATPPNPYLSHLPERDITTTDLVERILCLEPALRCLFVSGYAAEVIAHHGVVDEGLAFIQRLFSMKDLAVKVRRSLN